MLAVVQPGHHRTAAAEGEEVRILPGAVGHIPAAAAGHIHLQSFY